MDIPSRLARWKYHAVVTVGVMAFGGMSPSSLAQDDETEWPIAVQMYTLRDFGDLEEQLAALGVEPPDERV